MLVLGVDTATPAVSAGFAYINLSEPDKSEPLVTGQSPAKALGLVKVMQERATLDARAHGELLMPQVKEAAEAASVALTELGAVVCGVGPGPFTGLRAGIATASALAHALGITVYSVCSLDALAAQAYREAPLTVITDARRREVYWATYDAAGHRLTGPEVSRPDEVEVTGEVVIGPGVESYAAGQGWAAGPARYPQVGGLAAVALPRLVAGAEVLPPQPLYLRRPDVAEPSERKQVIP